ncbi:MAG: Na/Pi cotransporter family protein [Clostridia bacterium]|nr:Na/Pi cotransporter family protein [Clostridia bacterium]
MENFNVLDLIGGLALFLFGMNIMGAALEKKAGGQLKSLLGKMTDSPIKGFLLGTGVTAIIQSSSATTVMVVGFVNSGIMTLKQSIGVIMGANVGTTVTSWLISLMAVDGAGFMQFFKPSFFVPILAIFGVIVLMFKKEAKSKDTATIILGFATLMTGMTMMSDAVEGLKDVPEFANILTAFSNPVLGVLAGVVVTAVIQSSSASVGILQALSATGAIPFSTAIPVIMGQGIGTTVTALISSAGANKNAKRAAFAHFYFNAISTPILLAAFYGLNAVIGFDFLDDKVDEFWIAVINTVFKLCCVALWMPFTKLLEKIATITIRDKDEKEHYEILDDRLLATPTVAVERCKTVTERMAEISKVAIDGALNLLGNYDKELYERVIEYEKKADRYEDRLGSYLVKVSALELSDNDAAEATKLLHIIGDLERISDYAVNILNSVDEIRDKKLNFSGECQKELEVMVNAVRGVVDLSYEAFNTGSLEKAMLVEPLEQVVDDLKDGLKARHINRLQKGECTIELGFVLSDLLTNLERVSDHCSNIAGLIIEISHKGMDIHKYLKKVKKGENDFNERYAEFSQQYSLETV